MPVVSDGATPDDAAGHGGDRGDRQDQCLATPPGNHALRLPIPVRGPGDTNRGFVGSGEAVRPGTPVSTLTVSDASAPGTARLCGARAGGGAPAGGGGGGGGGAGGPPPPPPP